MKYTTRIIQLPLLLSGLATFAAADHYDCTCTCCSLTGSCDEFTTSEDCDVCDVDYCVDTHDGCYASYSIEAKCAPSEQTTAIVTYIVIAAIVAGICAIISTIRYCCEFEDDSYRLRRRSRRRAPETEMSRPPAYAAAAAV
eukprot:CAMPEP_0182462336 /NCGR_PEP_ID=MMETSP1319-20130603/6642_1 /TAXON_ID=172717 /ORGANISM="Bolidomonas pacifica, Strain RCC208" /LENGTH=140 /DNA_ID=CAMNT_0024661759 /DNA_START=30 /DNA_END=452 /DNA_ORIENTATION=+